MSYVHGQPLTGRASTGSNYVLPPEEAENISFDDKYFFDQLANKPVEKRDFPVVPMNEMYDEAREVYQM